MNTTRFSEKDIIHAMERTTESREETIRILTAYGDTRRGDVDDVIDKWEDDEGR